jgi:hypothetical protein
MVSRFKLRRAEHEIERSRSFDSVYVSFVVLHRSFEPEAISALLDLEPDNVVRKGETIVNTGKYHVVAEQTHWTLSSDEYVSSNFVEAHLDWILEQLFGKLPSLRRLQDTGGDCAIHVRVSSWSSLVCHAIDPDQLQLLARMRIPVDFVVHFEDSECEF